MQEAVHSPEHRPPSNSAVGETVRPPAMVGVTRGGIVESVHLIRYAIAGAQGRIIDSGGDIDSATFLRSSAKPLICAAVVASGAAERYGLTDVELAVASGSHSGEPFHVAAVRGLLAKIGLDESALCCGAHPPIHAPSAQALSAAGARPLPIHNNCSGKHAAILTLAMHRGGGPHGYLSPEHPAQKEVLDGCARLLEVPRASFAVGVDGCGVPVIAVPMRTAAAFFARLAHPQRFGPHWSAAVARVRDAMIAHPEYVGGTERFDTALMRAGSGCLLAKGGAEGYHAVSALAHGVGMCLKVADGNPRAVPPAVLARLVGAGIMTREAQCELERYREPPVSNHAGTVVGEIIALQTSA